MHARKVTRTGIGFVLFVAAFSGTALDSSIVFSEEWTGIYQESEPHLVFLRDLLHHPGEVERDPYAEPIETDRHDFTQSAKTVGRGVVQFEGGYSYFYKDNAGEFEHSHVYPELLLRVGITDNIEFRCKTNYVSLFREGEHSHGEPLEDASGSQDVVIGLKLQLTEPEEYLPESALRVVTTIPSGGDQFSTDQSEFGLDLVYAWELPNEWELAGSTGVFRNGGGEYSIVALSGITRDEEVGNFAAWAQSLALGVPLGERNELYLEYYGLFSSGLEEEFVLGFINAGIDHLLTDDIVIDLRIGHGLTNESDDFFVGVGGGVRY